MADKENKMEDSMVDHCEYYCWNDGERHELHDIFTLLDTENRGVISLAELVAILSSLIENDKNDETATTLSNCTTARWDSAKVTSTNNATMSRKQDRSSLMTKRFLECIRFEYGSATTRPSTTQMPLLLECDMTNCGCGESACFDQRHQNQSLKDIFLNRDEFVHLATAPMIEPNDVFTDDESVFRLYDVEDKGYIDVYDVQRVATELNWYKDENAPTTCATDVTQEPTTKTPSSVLVKHNDVTAMVYLWSNFELLERPFNHPFRSYQSQ
jgi:Ca2+-binding EF-hand superfamily protein